MLDLKSFEKAINSLEQLILKMKDKELMNSLDEIVIYGLKAGIIQNFEFTYEISWKYIKRWLELNIGSSFVDGVSRRQLFRLAIEHHLIENVDIWMDYHLARNRTSHTYNLNTAEEVYKTAIEFLGDVKKLYKELELKND
ncbi:nucleotidyltransferase substrate binding protein [Haliovirga abyssi]|uniref:Nucleotidyltransferase n=1 Tax=Haliovirga abyssi TaxID=2996794 RepID=A0AAU9DWS6_9FUSO|nr:nucleotidyltransferase substrate binding protein [Haliovirga abyssi]BDU49730.1 nucleotidyltransferase [Haliovirga abyssi]